MRKTFLTLIFTFFLGSFAFGQTPTPTPQGMGSGRGNGIGNGSGIGRGNGMNEPNNLPKGESIGVRILSNPRPPYTNAARQNGIEGVVRLRVTFLASGEIGSITPLSGLPHGLTEQAMAAAKQINFEPARKNGLAVSSARVIEYSFSTFFREGDKELTQNAEIIEMPAPQDLVDDAEVKNLSSNLKLTVALGSNGTARLVDPNPVWSKELTEKISATVAKIKFKPAIHQSGNAVTQLKEIELKVIE